MVISSWKRKLKMGMIGGGQGAFIGHVHRVAAMLDQQIELTAACFSRDPANCRDTGQQTYLQPHRCYESAETMAKAEAALPPDQRIDFVTIATPNVSHFTLAKLFLDNGFHVVCDKPVTQTLEDAKALVKLVEDSGLVFGLTHNYTGYPLVRHARSLFQSGEMGQIRKVIVEYLQDFFAQPHEKQGQKQAVWRMDPQQAGVAGALADCGSHCINLLEYVTGDPVTELCADRSTFLPDRELDEDVNILMRFQGGGKGVMAISQIATGEENGFRLKIYAEHGAVLWEQENPNELKVYRMGKPREILTRGHEEYLSGAANVSTRLPTGHPEGFYEGFANIYCGIAEAIRSHLDGTPMKTGDYNFPTVYDGLREMEFIYKAVESCEKGSVWVQI